jgi:hypothetical protein
MLSLSVWPKLSHSLGVKSSFLPFSNSKMAYEDSMVKEVTPRLRKKARAVLDLYSSSLKVHDAYLKNGDLELRSLGRSLAL